MTSTLANRAPQASAQETPAVSANAIARKSPRECGAEDQALTDTTWSPLRGRDGAALTGIVFDSGGSPILGARVAISGVVGEWRAGATGAFAVRGVPLGARAVTISAIGFLHECRIVDFVAHDSVALTVTLMRIITKLSAVQIREREHKNLLKDEIDQRRRAGFGYRADSLELDHLPGLPEALNFPGVRVTRFGGRWGISMFGSYHIQSKGESGSNTTCSPTIWIDGAISSMDMLNDIQKDEVAVIEVYNSAARAPLQFAGTRNLCGVVLVWRKQYVNP